MAFSLGSYAAFLGSIRLTPPPENPLSSPTIPENETNRKPPMGLAQLRLKILVLRMVVDSDASDRHVRHFPEG